MNILVPFQHCRGINAAQDKNENGSGCFLLNQSGYPDQHVMMMMMMITDQYRAFNVKEF